MMEERPEESAAVRTIIEAALEAAEDDDNPSHCTMAILAAAYTTGATALLAAGMTLEQVEESVRGDFDICLRMIRQAHADPTFPRPQ